MEGVTSYEAAAAAFAKFSQTPSLSAKSTQSPSPTTGPQPRTESESTNVILSPIAALPTTSVAPTPQIKNIPSARLQRSRERNRVHARKTRARKKEQMTLLTTRADELKTEQARLKQSINEKNTASILVGLLAGAADTTEGTDLPGGTTDDPRVEFLLKRKVEDIPDASKITELPALILPGQHNSKKSRSSDAVHFSELPDDGIDYELLGKDRSKCTPEEIDRIRRERNRMHAKRTRDRKRLFMEEMSSMCMQLEQENVLLRRHLRILDGETPDSISEPVPAESGLFSPSVNAKDGMTSATAEATDQFKTLIEVAGSLDDKQPPGHEIVARTTLTAFGASKNSIFGGSLQGMISLSEVASSVATAVSASDSNNSSASASISEHHEDHHHQYPGERASAGRPTKRPRISDSDPANSTAQTGVPYSITTSAPAVQV